MSTASEIKKDDILVFIGYTDPNMPEEDKLLTPGQQLKVWEVDPSGAVAVLPQKEDGTFDEENGDSVYEGEFMTLAEFEASQQTETEAEPAAEAPAAEPKKRRGKATTKAEAEPAAETKPAAKKATTKKAADAKPATTKPATTKAAATKTAAQAKADAKAHLGGKDEAKAETAPATITAKTADQIEVAHSSSVAAILSEQDALEAAVTLVNKAAETDYTLGGVLAEIKRTGAYQRLGYDGKRGFEDYTEKTLGVRYRKAMYLIDIYEHYQQLGIAEERLAEIGWSKAKELTGIKSLAQYDELHEFAKNHTRDELLEHLRSTVNAGDGSGNGSGAGTTAQRISRKFSLFNEQAETVERALASAKSQAGSDDDNAALEHICAEWMLMNENNELSLDDMMGLLETKFGVVLQVVPEDDAAADEATAVDEDDVVTA